MADLSERQRPLAADLDAPRLGGLHAGAGSLNNQGALELGQHPHHVEVEPPAYGRGVDALGEGTEACAPVTDQTDRVDQVGKGPAKPVELPDYQAVACGKAGKGLVQTGPAEGHAGNLVLEHRVAARHPQRGALKVEVLVVGRDSGIADIHAQILKHPCGMSNPLKSLTHRNRPATEPFRELWCQVSIG